MLHTTTTAAAARGAGVLALLASTAGCAASPRPTVTRTACHLSLCGTELYAGHDGLVPVRLKLPAPGSHVPPAPVRSVLPPREKWALPGTLELIAGRDCAHGVTLRVSAPADTFTAAVAYAEDGTVDGVRLDSAGSPDATVYAYDHGRVVGCYSAARPSACH